MISELAGADAVVEVADLRSATEQRPNTGVAAILVALVESRGAARFCSRACAFALEHPKHEGGRRPLLALAEHLVRLTRADRRLGGRLRS